MHGMLSSMASITNREPKGARMGRQKVTLALSEQALEIVDRHASERKRGEFVSTCIEEWDRRQREPDTKGGILERIEARLARIEQALAGGQQ